MRIDHALNSVKVGKCLALMLTLVAMMGAAHSQAVALPCPDVDGDQYLACDGICDVTPGRLCGDCDDASPDTHPLAAETCNGLDDDCDREIDENLLQPCTTACGSGEQICVRGHWTGCDARPCCDCSVGVNAEYPDVCAAASAGCHIVCLVAGVYEVPCTLDYNQGLVGLNGPEETTVLGDVAGGILFHGLTILGNVSPGSQLNEADMFSCAVQGSVGITAESYNRRKAVTHNAIAGNLHVRGFVDVVQNQITVGGIAADDHQYSDIGGVFVLDNQISDCAAAVEIDNVSTIVDSNFIERCSVGIKKDAGGFNQRPMTVTRNYFRQVGDGITVVRAYAANPLIANNILMDVSGTGIRVDLSGVPEYSVDIRQNLIANSVGSSGSGAGIELQAAGYWGEQGPVGITLQGNTIVGFHDGVSYKACQELPCGRYSFESSSNIIVENDGAGVVIGGPLQVHQNRDNLHANGVDLAGDTSNYSSSEMVMSDPLFENRNGNQFGLLPGSACIDAGVGLVGRLDLLGYERTVDGDLDGMRVADIGAIERAATIEGLDFSGDGVMVTWQRYPGATHGYDIYSGSVAAAHQIGWIPAVTGMCGIATEQWATPAVPVGEAYYIIVVPHGVVLGSAGFDSRHRERPITYPCP
ncbi:MAG TPA: putative metal-binding motif-containing protein [Candidatus Polarisedimenticolia bacterium]|nr:putative metal-binding motif-containing protein [Candidatus Polarisedimenticolia bacterium]